MDGSWNFFHMSYSKKEEKATFYIKYGMSGAEEFHEIAAKHYEITGYLSFHMGNYFHKAPPGLFTRINFGLNQKVFAGSKDAALAYFKKSAGKPLSLRAAYALVGVIEEYSYMYTEQDIEAHEFDQMDNAFEYSVFGHFKWTAPAWRADWSLLFRLSSTEGAVYNNANSLGDRDLSVWVHSSNFIHFTTYDFAANSNVNLYTNQYFDYNEFNNKWFFIYYGYSRTLKKAVYYLKFEKSEYSGSMDCLHFVSKKAHLRVAKDEWHYAWNGEVKHIHASFGEGAFRTENYAELMKLKVKQFADEDQYQGKPEFAAGAKDPIESSYFNTDDVLEHKFDMSQLTTIDYSWSAYIKSTWKTPKPVPLGTIRWNYQNVGGITRDGSKLSNTALGDRTLAMFVNRIIDGTSYSLQTYNQENGNPYDAQNVPLNFENYELGWTWVYMGYSSRRQKAYAVIQTGLDQQFYELSWPGRQHNKKPGQLVFKLGGTEQTFNGRYFDVRVDYGPGSYFGNLEDVQAYKTKFVPNPPATYATKTKDTLLTPEEIGCGRTQPNDEILTEQRYFKFPGVDVLEYAIHGWFRWSGWKPDTWNNLFRVSINGDASNDCSDLGDRDLAVWCGPGYMHYTTSTYEVNYGDNWNVVNNIGFEAGFWEN